MALQPDFVSAFLIVVLNFLDWRENSQWPKERKRERKKGEEWGRSGREGEREGKRETESGRTNALN